MERIVAGVITASLLAPFVFALFILLLVVTFVHDFPFELELLYGVLFVSLGALIEYGFVLFPASAVIAYGLYRFGIRSPWPPIFCGAALGPTLTLLMSPHILGIEWISLLAILPGAICGWIYWRIALYRTARSTMVEER
ncbi:hypothetical protein MHY87_17195 [Microvirga sp. ACRRW]|uniref:hypothetical protein n=1 Tax=Microvirga sp. ACRRW TaxID=2918205 RepID=UPI001EF64A02|nr:hypothetical protein [Microvirga sp. ACRRW]MCG7394643.1 hypothetical protein [Microvirga sp. ACRRW]